MEDRTATGPVQQPGLAGDSVPVLAFAGRCCMKWKTFQASSSPVPHPVHFGEAILIGNCLNVYFTCGAYLSQLLFLYVLCLKKDARLSMPWAARIKHKEGS